MPIERRSYVGGALLATLGGDITSSTSSFTINTSVGWPDGSAGPFHVVLDRGGVNEEKVKIATRSGLTLTVAGSGRGADGTTALSHNTGVSVELCVTALDLDEANRHTADTTQDDHGQYIRTDGTRAFTGLTAIAGTTAGTLSEGNHTHTGLAGLVAYKQYFPSGADNKTTTSATSVDADATNLAVTFTVPASGNVLVRFGCSTSNSAGGGASTRWAIREGAAEVSIGGVATLMDVQGATTNTRCTAAWIVTGLTPGASKTYKWGLAATSGTATLAIGAANGTAIMEVYAL